MPRLPGYLMVETPNRGHAVAAVLGPRGAIGIDSPLIPAEAESWRRKVLDKTPSFSFIVQMDASPDRAFAAAHIASIYDPGSPALITHQHTADSLRSMQDSYKNSPLAGALEATACGLDPLSLRWPRPSIAFQKEITFHWETTQVVIRHAPSVQPGACWVYLPESDIVLIGDAVSISLPPLMQDSTIDTWLETLATLKRAPFKKSKVFCSHGGWIDSEQVSRFAKFLQTVKRKTESIREKDSPEKEIQVHARSLLDFFAVPADRKEFALHRLYGGLIAYWNRGHAATVEKNSAD